MYLSFYNLNENPFQISTDPRFLWLGAKHEEGLATLKYGIQENKGFLLLTGDVGTGKTTLVNALLKTLESDTLVAVIRDPDLEPLDFYNYISYTFNMEREFTRKGLFLIHFEKFLHKAYAEKKKVLLIIDEAQRINSQLLEEVRLLSNIEREDSKLLNIFFVGQLEFNETLRRPENRAIRQRLTINYNLPALSELETGRYIKHRLEVAGAEEEIHTFTNLQKDDKTEYVQHGIELPEIPEEIFTVEAIKEIYSFSKGYPRLINIICDRCLLTGFVEESKSITAHIVRECKEELKLPGHEKTRKEAPQFTPVSEEGTSPFSQETINTPVYIKCDPPPRETISPADIAENMEAKEGTMLMRKLILAGIIIFMLASGYLSLSPDKLHVLQNYQAFEYTRGIWQAVFNPTDTQKQDPIIKTTPQVKSVPEEKPETSPSGSQKKIPPLEKGNMKAVYSTGPAVDTVTPVEPNETSLLPQAKEQPPEKERVNKQNRGNSKDIPIIPSVTFKKLTIPFTLNSNFPSVNSLKELNILANALLTKSSYRVIVNGFTDSRGSRAYNQNLSEFRANSIKSYLIGRGVPEWRITTQGFSTENPIAPNSTNAGRSANRRVEIEIIK